MPQRLNDRKARRTDRRLCAFRMADWSPRDLIEHNEQEARRDEAEGVRLAYVAATRYKFDDFAPYLYKTNDYGKTWTKITNGIPDGDFVWAVAFFVWAALIAGFLSGLIEGDRRSRR